MLSNVVSMSKLADWLGVPEKKKRHCGSKQISWCYIAFSYLPNPTSITHYMFKRYVIREIILT